MWEKSREITLLETFGTEKCSNAKYLLTLMERNNVLALLANAN